MGRRSPPATEIASSHVSSTSSSGLGKAEVAARAGEGEVGVGPAALLRREWGGVGGEEGEDGEREASVVWCGRGGVGVGAASRAAGRRRRERRGEGDRGRGRGRERGSIRSRGGTILMAHHPSVRHKYIHANGAPHPGAPLVFFFYFCSSQQVIYHLT